MYWEAIDVNWKAMDNDSLADAASNGVSEAAAELARREQAACPYCHGHGAVRVSMNHASTDGMEPCICSRKQAQAGDTFAFEFLGDVITVERLSSDLFYAHGTSGRRKSFRASEFLEAFGMSVDEARLSVTSPQPWTVREQYNVYAGDRLVAACGGYMSKQARIEHARNIANAALIARAPELAAENARLRALLAELVAAVQDEAFARQHGDNKERPLEIRVHRRRQAIAAAKEAIK